MVFIPRNTLINDVYVKVHVVQIQMVYATKFLGIQIDAQLTWKTHIYMQEVIKMCCNSLQNKEKII